MRLVHDRDDDTAGHGRVVVACMKAAIFCQLPDVLKEGTFVRRVTRQYIG